MVKTKECYTKKKKDGGNYTTCVEGQKKKTKKIKKIAVIRKKPAPKPKKIKKIAVIRKKKPVPKPKARKSTAVEAIFGKAALGRKDNAIRKLVGNFRKGGKKERMQNYVTVKEAKNWFKDKGNRRWFDDKFEQEVLYPQESHLNENDYYGELKVKIHSGRKSKKGGKYFWTIPYGDMSDLVEQTGRDHDDLMEGLEDRQAYVAKKGSVAKVGRKYIKSLIEDAKNKKISYDFDETFQQFSMEDYIESELRTDSDRWGDEIEFKKEWLGI